MDLTLAALVPHPSDVVELDDFRGGQAVAQVGAVARPRAVQVDEHLGLGVEPAGGSNEGLEVDPVADAHEPQVDPLVLVAVAEDPV